MKLLLVFILSMVLCSNAFAIEKTISIDDATYAAMENAFAAAYGYKEEICDEEGICVDNPQSKEDFAWGKVFDYAKEITLAYQVSLARKQAEATALNAVKAKLDAAQVSVE